MRELSGQMVCVPDFLSCYCDLKRQGKEQGKAARSHFFGKLPSHMSLSALFTFRKYRLYHIAISKGEDLKLKTSVRVFKFYNTGVFCCCFCVFLNPQVIHAEKPLKL